MLAPELAAMSRLPGEKTREPGSRSGFTFGEAIIALILLAIGLVGASSIVVTESRARHHALCTSLASDVAAEKIDEIAAAGYTAIAQGEPPTSFAVPELPRGEGSIRCETDSAVEPRSDCLVTVIVTWEGGKTTRGRAVKSRVVPWHG